MSSKVTVLIVRFKIKPGKKELFRKALFKVIEAMQEEETFVNAIAHENIDHSNELVLYEIWLGTREEWLRVQPSKPYRKIYEEQAETLLDERSAEWLTPMGEWGSYLTTPPIATWKPVVF